MRKPKDFDAELKALDDKTRLLKSRKLQQLGELVIATGADALPIETTGRGVADCCRAEGCEDASGVAGTRAPDFFRGARRDAGSAAPGGATVWRRMQAARCRLLSRRVRDDRREWVVKRRERTRQLIELGGLVAKAGIVELTDDDRAVIFGALLSIAGGAPERAPRPGAPALAPERQARLCRSDRRIRRAAKAARPRPSRPDSR